MKILTKLKKLNYLNDVMSIHLIQSKLKASGKHSLIYLICIVFAKFVKSIPYLSLRKADVDIIFAYATKNQKDALLPVYERTNKKCKAASLSLNNSVSADYSLPIFYVHLISIIFLPVAVTEYILMRNKESKMRMLHGFQDYVLSLGNVIVSYFFLSFNKPKIVVVSNDHNSNIRAFLLVAKFLNIKKVYVQHASVSKLFPPLEQFDLALLDGSYAKEIYTSIGALSTKIELVGISKLDRVKKVALNYQMNQSKKNVVGIALNLLCDLSKLKLLLSKIDTVEYMVKIRLHPNQMKQFPLIKNELHSFDISWSNPLTEGADMFIMSCDYVVAGNSSILLEAAVLRRVAVYFHMDDIPHDYYGYVSSNICSEVKIPISSNSVDFESLKIHNFRNIKRYDASFGNEKYGYSSEFCSERISSFLKEVS